MKLAAQEAFHVGLCSLISEDGQILDGTVADLKLKDGDTVTGLVQPPRIFSGRWARAFAVVRSDLTVVTWGNPMA